MISLIFRHQQSVVDNCWTHRDILKVKNEEAPISLTFAAEALLGLKYYLERRSCWLVIKQKELSIVIISSPM